MVKNHTAPYHPQQNGAVKRKRGNIYLGDELRAMPLGGDNERDLKLPQIIRFIRTMPLGSTGETPNFLMMDKKWRLSDLLEDGRLEPEYEFRGAYVMQLSRIMKMTYDEQRDQQKWPRT